MWCFTSLFKVLQNLICHVWDYKNVLIGWIGEALLRTLDLCVFLLFKIEMFICEKLEGVVNSAAVNIKEYSEKRSKISC
ncbi:hypothetical protein TNIN_335441 [Trichonephila inaurata madagascariensis]|uniref:Uncharacterized protein n=1 Tax=Trichonephila inaurata madagascariensis TaxID=2747483 RepID=A0A8X6WSA0_9ARAC|nr:hypothetical protein TNIN_335441 [Trichonephila inaurata madagascariensis]